MGKSKQTSANRSIGGGLTAFLCMTLVSLLGVGATSAAPLHTSVSARVSAPSKPVLTAHGDYWGISMYFAPSAGSAAVASYEYSVNNGKTWKRTPIAYAFYAGKRGVTYTVMARARNASGTSAVVTARATQRALKACTPVQAPCPRIPLPSAFIRAQATLAINVGGSVRVSIHGNVSPSFDATGACNVSNSGVVTGTAQGLCDIYIFGYGDRVRSEGFAHDNVSVLVRPKGSPAVSNGIKPNDFACDRPVSPAGPKAGQAFLQVVSASKTSVTLHVGAPKNAAAATVTCYDYSANGGKTWKYAVDSKASGTFAVTNLTSRKTYKIIVRAVNKAGSGPVSKAVVVKTH